MASEMIHIHLNGQAEQVPSQTSVADLLERLGRKPIGLAVEVNRDVIPRSRHASTYVVEGDRVEIVQMVGGG